MRQRQFPRAVVVVQHRCRVHPAVYRADYATAHGHERRLQRWQQRRHFTGSRLTGNRRRRWFGQEKEVNHPAAGTQTIAFRRFSFWRRVLTLPA